MERLPLALSDLLALAPADVLQFAPTDVLQLAGAAVALVGTLAVGIAVHEYAHALALRALGVECSITWLPDRDERGVLRASLFGTWASVAPRALPDDVPAWGLRVAALMPLALALPYALIPLGIAPDPTATGNLYVTAAAVAWLGCALPSPQDFSVVWYAADVTAADWGVDA